MSVRFSMKRIAVLAAVVAVLAVAFLVASSLAGPRSAPSVLDRDIEKMEAAVPANPNDISLRFSLANAYLQADGVEEALGQFQEALVIEPESEEALLGAGLAHLDLGQPEEAAGAFTAIVALNQDNAYSQLNPRLQAAHYYLGRIYRQQGKLDEAVDELRRAIGINRGDADALFELGSTFQDMGEYADAASAFQVALAYVPDFVEAYEGLAEAARSQGDEVMADYAGAMVLVFDGKVKDGVERLERLAPQAEDSRVWWGLGHAYEQVGRVDEASQAYERAVEINPGELLAADALRRLNGTE